MATNCNQSPWSGFSDPSHRPAHSVAACFLRLPPFRGRCSSAKLSAGSLFYRLVQSCRRVVACFSTSTVRQAPFGCRCSSGTVPFLYLFIFFIYSVSPVCPFLPLLFASGLRSEKRLCCFLLSQSYALRYKRYTFFRPGFEGFLPSPPRLAAILAWRPRGSVPTLFDPTIYFHFNIFKSPTKLQSSRSPRPPFSFGTGIQIRCMYFW